MYLFNRFFARKTIAGINSFQLSFEKKILAYLILIVLIISTIVFISRRIIDRSNISKGWVVHTENILAQADTIISLQKDIVITTRGFIISGNPKFLDSYNITTAAIFSTLSKLKELAQDNAAQEKRLNTLEALIKNYDSIRQKAIEIRREKKFRLEDEAVLIHMADKTLTDINSVFYSFKTEAKYLLAQNKKVNQQALQNSALVVRALLLIFILSLIFAFIIVYRNTIKRNKAEAAYRESQGLIRGIIDHAPVLVNIKDRSGKYILANNQFAAALNSNPEELIGKANHDFLSFEFADPISKEDQEIIKTGQSSEIEIKIPAADGLHTYISSKFPLFNDKGKIYAVGSTAFDITAVKNAHEALEKSYQQQQKILNGLQQALSTSSDLICIINEKGEFVMVSSTSTQMLGYTPKEMMSKRFMDFVAGEDIAKTETVAKEIMSGNCVSDFTNHYKRKDGSLVPVIWSATWLPEDKMMYCIARNGTEKIKTAQQLEQSLSKLAHAQKIARLGNWDWDLKNNIRTYSDEIYELLGIEKNGEDITQFLLEAIHPDDRPMLAKLRDEALSLGKLIEIEHRVIRPDNTVLYMLTRGEVRLDKDGKPEWINGTMQDITELKKASLELQRLNEDLEKKAIELKASNAELERFAYVASHDLQEPLRMVSSFLSLLQKKLNGGLDETSNKYIHFAVDGAERMKGLIQDLLQYSRVGSDTEGFTRVDLKEVMVNVLHIYEPSIKETDAVVHAGNLPVVTGNKTQLTRLLQNLVGNALKYRSTKKPIIEIGCKEERNEWTIFIKDNGIGIDPKFFDKIFVIFQRLHNKNEYSGTGIGLAICKKIIERHGGKIWVDSSPAQGSTFYFTLKKFLHA